MQASKTLQNGRPSSLSTSIEETHRRLEHFVAPLSHTGNGGLDMQMRLDADALELPAVGLAHVVGRKSDDKVAGQYKEANVAAGPGCRRSDERHAGGRRQGHARMLRLALRLLIDQHHYLARVSWSARGLQGLAEGKLGCRPIAATDPIAAPIGAPEEGADDALVARG